MESETGGSDNGKLISLLEEEMHGDIEEIESYEKEDDVTAEAVKFWYLETEKIVRVIVNITGNSIYPAINQLRYAGHHALKAQVDSKNARQNLVEALKHCKRALYDAFDFYVYELNNRFRVVMPCLDSQKAIELEGSLYRHIAAIQSARFSKENRAEYYKEIQKNLIEGLRLIEKINEAQRESGLWKGIFRKKQKLVIEKLKAERSVKVLQEENKMFGSALDKRTKRMTSIISISVAIASFAIAVASFVVPAWITAKHEVSVGALVPSQNSQKTPHEQVIR